MQRLGDALAGDPRFHRPAPVASAGHSDYCSCHKASGEWGNHGMHWREFGEIDIRRRVDDDLAKLPGDMTIEDRAKVEDSLRRELAIYAGHHVAIEQCPIYRAKLQAEIDARKSQAERYGRRNVMLGDDL